MSKTTTNVLGIIIVILAGIYFYVNYCSECQENTETAAIYITNDPKYSVS